MHVLSSASSWSFVEHSLQERLNKGEVCPLLNSTPSYIVGQKDLKETIFEDWVLEMLVSILNSHLNVH